MKIETKYNLGDKVYYLYNNTIYECTIFAIFFAMDNQKRKCFEYEIVHTREIFPENILEVELHKTLDDLYTSITIED